MTDLRSEHIHVLKCVKWRSVAFLLTLALASIAFGLVLSLRYQNNGDCIRAILVLIPFCVIFPFGLFYVTHLSFMKLSDTEKLVRGSEPIRATIENLDAIFGQLRLHLSNGVGFFQVDDPAFGLINILKCELNAFEEDDRRAERQRLDKKYLGKDGTLYIGSQGEIAVLFVNNTVIRLQRISRQKAEELEKFWRNAK